MNYSDGQEVQAGDVVRGYDVTGGLIVGFAIGTRADSHGEEWLVIGCMWVYPPVKASIRTTGTAATVLRHSRSPMNVGCDPIGAPDDCIPVECYTHLERIQNFQLIQRQPNLEEVEKRRAARGRRVKSDPQGEKQ